MAQSIFNEQWLHLAAMLKLETTLAAEILYKIQIVKVFASLKISYKINILTLYKYFTLWYLYPFFKMFQNKKKENKCLNSTLF